MQVNKIIERAEKFRSLGRFDKKSAIDFLNDGLYIIAKRQSLKIEESVFGYTPGVDTVLNDNVIKVESAELKDPALDPEDFNIRVMQNGTLQVFQKNSSGEFVKPDFESNLEIAEIVVIYTGYSSITSADTTFELPNEFETALVYYVRSKMLEERGDIEMSQYFMTQFSKELITKSAPKVDVVSKPSPYSLM